MRIATSDITLASSRISVKAVATFEHLRKWNTNSDVTAETRKANGVVTESSARRRDVMNANGKVTGPALLKTLIPNHASDRYDTLREIKKEFFGSVRERIMKDMIEMITGRKIKLLDPSDIRDSGDASPAPEPNSPGAGNASGPKPQGWGVDYYFQETKTTKEGVAVTASGTVTTADGRTIDFTASLEMARKTTEQTTVSFKAGDALIDPLMIDTTGKGVQLSGVKFNFDLNSDGVGEQINAPAAGTGFLAYDRNGNGIIDNGAELFGPATGRGFSELSQFDADKNGWIDENDAAFNGLSVWQKTSEGTDSMVSLKNSGIGAIYLGHTASRFDLTDTSGTGNSSVAGVLRDTGVFMRESGQTGYIQEVDLVA
jgi:hypothetical protein